MYDSEDDDLFSCTSGYATPPLSPTKTVSTEGWMSPRTPGSPRKTRSCVFMRDDQGIGSDTFLTPPSSPTRSKPRPNLDKLVIPELRATCRSTPLHSDDDSPVKHSTLNNTAESPFRQSHTFIRSARRSSSGIGEEKDAGLLPVPSDIDKHSVLLSEVTIQTQQDHSHRTSESPTPPTIPDRYHALGDHSIRNTGDLSTSAVGQPVELPSLAQDHHSSLRSSSSPLRPSQWVARGGFLSSPSRTGSSQHDRFIANRRSAAITRDSFKLNKPVQRLEWHRSTHRGVRHISDVFSRRLRRSGRLNDELRGLREAHSVIIGRAIAGGRNATFRHGSVPLGVRQISAGAVWNVGGHSAVSDTVVAVSTGRGSMLGRGTNAPLYRSAFLNRADPEAQLEAYERRLALALEIDQTDRILQHTQVCSRPQGASSQAKHVWRDGVWIKDGVHMLLDAPQLRDDYYCTLLAYCHTSRCLAVGLGNFVHLWSERSGVETPESLNAIPENSTSDTQHVTSLNFSSVQGHQAILAVGRADGRITLWSSFDSEPRFDASQPKPISCLSWRPTTIQRPSLRDRAMDVPTEQLLVGDEVGHIYIYSVEWPSETQSALFGWHGAMTLSARLTIHTQQICGLAWSPDGELFASGGNDNNCHLFETKKALQAFHENRESEGSTVDVREGPLGESIYTVNVRSSPVMHPPPTSAKHKWTLNAAVKAIAFCPWQRNIIAISGGSNDRCIHFYHTRSGACLATIDCAAQVTSLIWSQTRREIAATFGFTQPDHPYRVAVFAWPSCEQVVAVPWWDENRALCAVAYPGSPTRGPQADDEVVVGGVRGEDGLCSRRGAGEGCIVVATSDMAIRFHEIWSDRKGTIRPGDLIGANTGGLLGGGHLLQNPSGVGRDEYIIR